MKRILVVGWCLPVETKDGASMFIEKLASYYKSLGHYVEVFTIARPERLTCLKNPEPWTIYEKDAHGIRFNILCRPWGLLHTDPYNPLMSAHEERTEQLWTDMLNKDGGWDMVHFNDVNPLSLIEITQKKGVHVRYSFHNFYLLFPIEHLFSYEKYQNTPFEDLTIYEPTGERAVKEYKALGVLRDLCAEKEKRLISDFEKRIEYGRYLLKEAIDEVLGASRPYIIFVREIFNCAFSNVIYTDFAMSNDLQNKKSEGMLALFEKKLEEAKYAYEKFMRKYKRGGKKIFGVFCNVTHYKGHHIIIKALENLKDCENEFEVRFYGHTDYDPEYVAFLSELLRKDPFLERHVRFMGGYNIKDLPNITEDTIATLGCAAISIGSGGAIYESLLEGNLPVFMKDYTEQRARRLLNENASQADVRSLRMTFKCGDYNDLSDKMRLIIKEENLVNLFERSLKIHLTGVTFEPDFAGVWKC